MKPSQGKIKYQPSTPSINKDNFCMQLPLLAETPENCAFDGAMMTLVPITDAAHLIHGPSGCISNLWGSRASFSSNSHLYTVHFSTDMEENDIIFGGTKKLYRAIMELARRYKPAAVFVYSTCVSALIGDDISGTCKTIWQQTGTPIIPVNAPGFVGHENFGNHLAGEALLEYVIGTIEPDLTTPYDINLIGEYNIGGAMWNVLPLLTKLGIRVLAKITGDACYQEICSAHRAKLNVIISSTTLVKMAKKMEERFGIPYIEASFLGVENINRCLRNIAAQLGDSDLQERTEHLIAEETTVLEQKIAPYRDRLQGKCIVISTESLNSWSIISAANYLNIEVIVINTTKISHEDRAKIHWLLGKDTLILEPTNSGEILQIIHENQADIFVSHHHYQFIALAAKIPFLDTNQKLHQVYTGYRGILTVARELYATLYSPIWQQIGQIAPWDEVVS